MDFTTSKTSGVAEFWGSLFYWHATAKSVKKRLMREVYSPSNAHVDTFFSFQSFHRNEDFKRRALRNFGKKTVNVKCDHESKRWRF